MNIMDMVKGAITNQVMGQIGGMLGMSDNKKTSSMLDTAMGSILGGMINKSSSQEGAKQVFDMASNADSGIMDKLGDILGGGGDQLGAIQKSGGGMLDGLLGGGGQTSMIQTIAKALGMDGSIVGKLLTFAAPMLLGSISKHIKSAGLDALGLSSLLGEQKQHIAAAMPSGLAGNLGFGNLLSGVGDLGKSGFNAASNVAGAAAGTVGNVAGAAGDAVGNVAGAAGNAIGNVTGAAGNAVGNVTGAAGNAVGNVAGAAGDATKKGMGMLGFLFPLLILGAIGYFAWPYISGAASDGANAVTSGVSDMGNKAAGALDFGGLDMSPLGDTGTKLQEGFSGITSGFTGLAETGEEGANALAGKITDFSGSIDSLGLGSLPDAAKPVATSMIGKFMETIQGMLNGQSGIIKSVLQGPVDTLLQKLQPFA